MHGYNTSTVSRFQSFSTPVSNLTWVQWFVTKLLSFQSTSCMVTKFNNPLIRKLPNTNVQPDPGSRICDQVTEWSVGKLHDTIFQQSPDSKASQHQCPTDLGSIVCDQVTEWSVGKLHDTIFQQSPDSKASQHQCPTDLGSVVCDQVTEWSVCKLHGYKIQQSSDSKTSQHQCPTDLGMAQRFVTTYVTKFSVCKVHARTKYFNIFPISKLLNTSVQPDLGSIVCDHISELSVCKLHG